MTTGPRTGATAIEEFPDVVAGRLRRGARFCALVATARGDTTRLVAVLSENGTLVTEEATVPAGVDYFTSLTGAVPAAAWYEREIRDLFGLEPRGHPRADPLVFPFPPGAERPRPGSGVPLGRVEPDPTPLRTHVQGDGVFTIPYGPVRSGVFEAIEYLVETPGEDIPHVRTRVSYKHRGVEARFDGLNVDDGVLLAERCEGVASVAHAAAFCQAVERIAGVEIPDGAARVRVLHAELERVANHLDSTVRHTEAAGQAVAYARFSLHKERVQRLRAQLCGSRFGRGVVIPGGVAGAPELDAHALGSALDELERALLADTELLMATPSFIDRLRGTGVLTASIAADYGALGPVGRASGQMDDGRVTRPYGGYRGLEPRLPERRVEGDALARQKVRLEEIWAAFQLIRQCIDRLEVPDRDAWRVPLGRINGEAIGWAEAPQGEVLYLVEVDEGRLMRTKPRSASFHNLALFASAFPKDILTDFAFIEASFGLSVAGVAG